MLDILLILHVSSVTLCDPMFSSLPDFSLHGIIPIRILEWVAVSFSRGSSRPRDQTAVPALAGRFFTTELPIDYRWTATLDLIPRPVELYGILLPMWEAADSRQQFGKNSANG